MRLLADIRAALAPHLGQELTPELATAITMAIVQGEDRAYDPASFAPATYRGYVFAVERFGAVLPELHKLHQLHFAETELHRQAQGMDPDYVGMERAERAGELLQFTCRHDGELVGNIRMYLQASMHTQRLVATEDTFFVLPAHRRGFMALRFWQFMERAVASVGAVECRTDSKVVNDVGRLNKYLGYRLVAHKFSKPLTQGEDHVQ